MDVLLRRKLGATFGGHHHFLGKNEGFKKELQKNNFDKKCRRRLIESIKKMVEMDVDKIKIVGLTWEKCHDEK